MLEPGPLAVDEARRRIAALLCPLDGAETVGLGAALGRVLATAVIAGFDVPPHDNAGMDGWALRAADLDPERDTRLTVAGRSLAGHGWDGEVVAGSCVRVMTGAPVPRGADTVVPQELCRPGDDGSVIVPARCARRGDNVRARGEDLHVGQVALPAGRLLRPADLGLLASMGHAEVAVRPRLRVAFLSSGDELRRPGAALDPGCIHDSNGAALRAMIERLGCVAVDLGLVPDDPAQLEAALRRGCADADVVLTSGGASVGDADHLKTVMAKLGAVDFWRVAMRPGRPLAVGRIASGADSALLFGLPGNPVAAMVAFYVFVRDALLRCMGTTPRPRPLLPVVALEPLSKRPGRTEFQRARLEALDDGGWGARLTGPQGSGLLHSMSEADGLLVLEHGRGPVAQGETVGFLGFEGLV